MESGARSLADTCFTQARSQEPADSATWAAMGALAGLSKTGATGGHPRGQFRMGAVELMGVVLRHHRPDTKFAHAT